MVYHCAAAECSSDSRYRKDVGFVKFPKTPVKIHFLGNVNAKFRFLNPNNFIINFFTPTLKSNE